VLQNMLQISANFAQNATLRVFTLSDSPMKGKILQYLHYITIFGRQAVVKGSGIMWQINSCQFSILQENKITGFSSYHEEDTHHGT